jgi:hypothetical protein
VTTTTRPRSASRRHLLDGAAVTFGVALLLVLAFGLPDQRDSSPYDPALPSPMGEPAAAAPGEATGMVTLAGLEVDGAEVTMGQVPLDVTVVPTWTVRNPTPHAISFTTGMPQVLEGCCPGPVVADGHQLAPGETVEVPASGSVELAFPLQMHEGMGGYHHLAVPLATPDGLEVTALQVTGDFLADATL